MAVEAPIQISTANEEPGAKYLRVEVPVERVHAAEEAAARQYAKRAKLPGFRPGKAPLAVVRRQYREAIRERVLRELIGESWKAAVDQQGLEPIADPRVRDVKFEEDKPMTFELLVEVKPEIRLPRLGGFTLTRRVSVITDDLVGRQIEELRRQKGPWLPLEGGQPQLGDLVSVSIATAPGGETPAEGQKGAEREFGEARQYQIELGTGQAIPDVEAAIMALSPGETVECVVRFPDDFPDAERRGQRRLVRITLHEAKRQQLPEVNDAFARELGDFETVEDLRRAVRQDLETAARREADAEVRRQVIDQVIEANDVPAPRPMVERALAALAQAYEVPDERLEAFVQEFGPIAERQVRRDLIIERVAELNELKATEEDLDRRIAELAGRRGVEPKTVYTSLQQAGRLRELEHALTEEKVFAFLLSQSTVQDAPGG